MAPYSKKLAIPFEAWRLVIAAVRVVCSRLSARVRDIHQRAGLVPFRDQRDQSFLQSKVRPDDSHRKRPADTYRR